MLLAGAISIGAWGELRRRVGAWRTGFALSALPLDILPVALGLGLLVLASARPVFSACLVAAAAVGLAVCDAVKRSTLREPLVFADRAELLELIRHPKLYVPFAGTALVVAGVAGAGLACAAAAWIEPPVLARSTPAALAASAIAALLGWAACAGLWVPPAAGSLERLRRRWKPSGDPAPDMARLGMLACFLVHATTARAERPARRAAPSRLPARLPRGGPIVVVQAESFMDLRRFDPALGEAAQPGWVALQREACLAGRLHVPAWGANTIRTEFAVLTGLAEADLGLDRFNPYEAFATDRIASLAGLAKRAGYRTVCLHPFDLRFYRRSTVLPALQFDRLIGPEAFPRGEGDWVADAALAPVIAAVLAEPGPPAFLFAITMEAHGPWLSGPPHPGVPPRLAAADGGQFGRYAAKLAAADALIRQMRHLLAERFPSATLLCYGDHQPSLPGSLAASHCTATTTDYAIWRPNAAPGPRRDLAAPDLAAPDLAAPDLAAHDLAAHDLAWHLAEVIGSGMPTGAAA